MVARAVIHAIDDSKKVQTLKLAILTDEVSEDVERFQEYGFSSVPFPDSEAIMVCVGGRRSHGVVVATDDRARRPKSLAQGDSALYNANGVRVLCDNAADEVLLGSTPAEFVALSNLVLTELGEIKAELDKITATLLTGSVPGPLAVTFATPYTNVYTADSVAADEVKAK